MPDWNKVLEYLEPKMPPFCPETPSLTQKVFLRSYSLEALFGGAAGGGKLIYTNTVLPTPNGFVKMGDIKPGDFIFGRDGNPHVVLAESDVEIVDGYKLTFDDGSTVDAHDEHLWLTYDARELAALTKRTDEYRAKRKAKRPSRATNSQGEYKSLAVAERNTINKPETLDAPTGTVRTTSEIVATLLTPRGRRNHAIPVAETINLPPRNLLIDPYVLGVWLGDGSSAAGVVTSMDDSIIEEVEQYGYQIKSISTKVNNKASMFLFEGLRRDLKKLGLLKNKHVPHDYLWASEEQRVALLQGLMDTDGTVAKNSGSAEFCNTNKAIVDGLAFLVRSLGMKATIREGRAKLNGKDYGPKWTIKFVANRPVFRLDRKLALQKIASRRTTQFRYIVSAERTGPLPMKCIRVSSPDSLYLVSEDFIPTHNSSALLMAAMQYIDVPGYSAIIFRRTYADLALPGAIMDRFIHWMSTIDDVRWNANNYTAVFPSGARISFGYLNNSQDFLRYKGAEFQFIGMDEVTEIRESDYRYMFSRLRRPGSGPLSQVPLRMRSACNPAPNWVRQRFIVEGISEGRIFVPSKLSDNPGIDADSYRQALQALDPLERRRLEEGDWWATTLGSMFSREAVVIIDHSDIPQITTAARAVRFWDLAATEPSYTNPDPDWTVGTLMLFDGGIAYVLDIKKARVKGEKVEQLIAQTAYEDGHTVAIRMEQEPGSSGKALVDQYARNILQGFDFGGIRSTGDKITRARPFAAAVANGNVRCLRGPWLTDWLDEMSSFPEACNHDDQVDSAVSAFTYLSGLGLPQRKKIGIII
jgi:predicted phage terminase large subunit-like protein